MQGPDSGLILLVAQILNQTASQAAANAVTAPGLLVPSGLPLQNQYAIINVGVQPSASLAIPSQGQGANPAGRLSDADSPQSNQLDNLVSIQAGLTYRM